jgi:hypothetical protein
MIFIGVSAIGNNGPFSLKKVTAIRTSALQQTLKIDGAPWTKQDGATTHTAHGT